MKKFFAFACVAIIGFFVGRYMFPSNEYEIHNFQINNARIPLKVNRRTGEAWRFTVQGWQPIENMDQIVERTPPEMPAKKSSFIPVTEDEMK